MAEANTHTMPLGLVIPGILKYFDLPDLARAIAPRPLRIERPSNGSDTGIGR